MIEIRDLWFEYAPGGFALEAPAFDLAAGERVAVVGPSGSGKTTFLNLVAGIALPKRGSVKVDGREVSSMPDRERRAMRARRIGFVFQEFELVEYLDARDNILHPFRISEGPPIDDAARKRAEALAEATGIAELLGRRPRRLSQGEKQRVAICRALVTEPGLVLADEATGNLDPENKTRILDLLFERAEAQGAAVLAVTHDHDLLSRFDRVLDFADFRAGGAPA